MVKFKRIYSIISCVIAVLLGLVISVAICVKDPECVAAFKGDKLTKQDCQVYKKYANSYAKTLNTDAIDNNDIEISKEINENTIIITVNETKGGIKATYPIEIKALQEEGKFVFKISYKDGKYEEYSNIRNISYYIGEILLIFVRFGAGIWLIIHFLIICIVSIINWIIVKVKK